MVQDEQLHERQGLGPVQVGPDRVLAEPIGAQVGREVQLFPDRLLDLGGDVAVHLAGDADMTLGSALLERDAAIANADERRQVGMGKHVAQDHLGVQSVGVAVVPGRLERDDHVGVALLGADELRRVRLPFVELLEHLIGRVSPPGGVAPDLPSPAQLLGGAR